MSEQKPQISTAKRVSPLWIVPLVALVAGIWIVVHAWATEGPTITIDFETAAGLEKGKTKVKLLNVEVGLVEEVILKPDVSGVTATVKLDKEVEDLLREDTRFWVVRARVGAGGVSGIGTILSGAYIELDPGSGDKGEREYVGLESPPVTPAGAPGKHLVLTSDRATTGVGDPILYQGFRVGRVESMEFDAKRGLARYGIFVEAPYDGLIHSATRFWDTSGIAMNVSAEGFQVQIGALETLLVGGVAFGSPPELPRGTNVRSGAEFRLYGSYADILEDPYTVGTFYVVAFSQSLAGLVPGAPVTYKGIEIGRVERILVEELTISQTTSAPTGSGADIPVLIYLEPGRVELPDVPESVTLFRDSIEIGVDNGLRATLKTGNLLTGRRQIALDFYDSADAASLGEFNNYAVIPSIESGVGRLEEQISELLATLNTLPLDDTVAGLNGTLVEMERVLANLNTGVTSINSMLASQGAQQLPDDLSSSIREIRRVLEGFSQDSSLYQDLNSSLANLDRTLENIDRLAQELAEKPNAVIFAPKPTPDPIPEARQ